ncbi:MAG: branched-chain amino acid transport system II carrier protein [Parachlamydia sp.]|nr:branched-chain amino acid transport system II carrier protein [Parachlamydia sp.]
MQAFIVGMALFSMFFGGGNLTFPIWIGSETSSVSLSSLGFILSGVLLPLYGTIISLYFKGDYEYYLNAYGKRIGALLLFSLLVFWIPLGSGPRCNLLAYGAFVCQTAWDIPLLVYSAAYSVVVYLLTFRENRVIEILGKAITPMLIITLLVLIFSIFSTGTSAVSPVPEHAFSSWNELLSSFFAGYYTMDFIAAIFFSSAVIALVKEKQKDKFNIRLIRNACLIAVTLLSIIYVGLIAIGHAHADVLAHVPKDRLLAVLGQTIFHEKFQIIIFAIITLSVLSTSMALSLVFSNYLRKFVFKEKLSHGICLFISVLISFLMSIIGFDKLAILISYATSALYPFLLLVTSTALAKDLYYFYVAQIRS